MRLLELFEDAQGDLDNQRKAREIANAFGKWMAPRNEETPLDDIQEVSWLRLGLRDGDINTRTISGRYLGVEGCDDLHIGFGWRKDGAPDRQGAFMVPATDEGRAIFYVIALLDKDASKDVDVLFRVRWEHLIHELTHYLDRKRQKTRSKRGGRLGLTPSASSKTPEGYYNHPLEFNAYYQQGLYSILNDLTREGEDYEKYMRDYQAFRRAFAHYFDGDFRFNLNDEYKRRFEKRFHAFYVWVRDLWPDATAIRRRIEADTDVT